MLKKMLLLNGNVTIQKAALNPPKLLEEISSENGHTRLDHGAQIAVVVETVPRRVFVVSLELSFQCSTQLQHFV